MGTLDALESGKKHNYSEPVKADVEAALGWQAGSVDEVLAGRKPVDEPDPELAELLRLWVRLPANERRRLVDAAESALRNPS